MTRKRVLSMTRPKDCSQYGFPFLHGEVELCVGQRRIAWAEILRIEFLVFAVSFSMTINEAESTA